MTQDTTQEWDAAIERELDRVNGRHRDQQVEERVVANVETLLRKAQAAGADLHERSFLAGAMAAFRAVYGEIEGRPPRRYVGPLANVLCPSKWILADHGGRSIFDK